MKFGVFNFAAGLAMAAAVPLSSFSSTTYFFTFGDSYSQTNFNVSGEQPNAVDPMGNPTLGTGTTGGGINWIGRLTTTYNDSLVLSYNLAVGGATINNAIVNSGYEDMTSQVATFQYVYSNKSGFAPWKSSDAVFGFWIGINDIGNGFKSQNASQVVPRLMAQYKYLFQSIYADGGRKFLFLNVPPTNRSPFILDQGLAVSRKHTAWLADYNEALKLMVLGLRDRYWDTQIVLYDSFKFMTKVLNNPQGYGFRNASCIDDDGARDMKPYLAAFEAW
ncbi:Acetylesterase [Penicillium taxi]|uniref:Acetylesterase n=1 Tax=Penicillium taxi TaxID=168475 RepID=UPI002544F4EA|nr:Acetylesterase [Penicillium taxi]KAJ5888300.1 Acetylesterase [Penicillium taxi]